MSIFVSILLALVWSLALPVPSQAKVVGRFQQVAGPVDLFKQGKPPALSPKVADGVEPGDVIRTKSKGRAQVKFVDDSVLTIAPRSRVAVETYMYDAARGSRKAVLQVFRGMVQTVVNKILKTSKPNFLMKTHTAVLGVRGTRWYALLGPDATDIYTVSGRVSVRNIFAEVQGEVILNAMEFSRVMTNLAPTAAMPFKMQDLAPLEQMLQTGVSGPLPPPSAMGGPVPLAFLDRFNLFDVRSRLTDNLLSINRQPIITRDFLLRRDLLHRPGILGNRGGGGHSIVIGP